MLAEKQCPWCGDRFTPIHGNDSYCSEEHRDLAKRERQKSKRDPIKDFIPILMANHEIIDGLYRKGITEISREELGAYRIDISLCRHLKPPTEHIGTLMLDFGEYYLLTETNFFKFKIYKHAAITATYH